MNSMQMQQDWQRLYAELGTQQQAPSDVVDPWAPGRTDYGSAPITQQQQRQPLQVQPMSAPEIQQPKEPQQQEDDKGAMGQMLMGALMAMSDPQTKVIHDKLNAQFAQAAEPITYEYKPEAQKKYGMPAGIRQGVDARRLAEEGGPLGDMVTTETEDGLKGILPDEGLGVAMSQAAQANVANQRQDLQMRRMMEALDARMYEQELRNRMRSTV